MYKELSFSITGVSPLIVHNGQLANPLNPFSREIKKITSKGSKHMTDDDHARIAELEWRGSLYLDANGQPCIPGENIEAGMISAGKKQRLGKQFQAGLMSDGMWTIIHDGPKDLDKLFAEGRFVDTRRAGIKASSVMRTRAIFPVWSLKFKVQFLPEILNETHVRDALITYGRVIGMCDYRPRYGRFEVNGS